MTEKLKEIMLVDDEAGIRALLSDALMEKGFKVTIARNGKESLRQLKKHRFDLLITDVNMPQLSGLELIKKMKKSGRKETVILISGEPVDMALLNQESMPVFAQLKKPFRMNQFLNTVISALESNKSQSKRRRNAS